MRGTATPTGLRLLTGASALEATGIAQRACGNPFLGFSSHSRLKAKSGNIGVPRAHELLCVREAHSSRSASSEYINLSHFHFISSNVEVKKRRNSQASGPAHEARWGKVAMHPPDIPSSHRRTEAACPNWRVYDWRVYIKCGPLLV